MNPNQRESIAKYLYDLSKGTILIAVVGNLVADKVNIIALIAGIVVSLLLFLWAVYTEEGGT